ncbi:lysophospholipid acyltransferase family protein [Cytobacillus firmus]|uniref:Acyl-CoA:1-acyl-sn-glycerol-3-phosphate acyltransferase n=1 Tax=Cytobacillus firmus TaxID=1399 RepID=A0A380XW14_CYTFI|nr:lysophospholipid acyltransferase family protein [Cytobacillus firmus]KAF0825928.1 Acyl-CoA:1-acyl-sn-glycerol-3-phosphate acyltransferase [Cytobacillus firmus]MBG9544535.1 acyl-phosphate glycerol 3-phosphate acyltransferase [Cytobacillus firmus]MBG9546332.1 acyl-phosphate glycerol 3-phosphate acyltransferase [Cytobacillus firmus]MBG9551964.1 acyl-phosphate glycerol 3-phosphate acyltransferase [Cytobacillus firmus]MBG9559308.1 acyl-phosphate glycerol 3-phosphate acyltransferase [Cytobacillus
MNLYAFAKAAVYGVLKPIYRFEVIGKENIPAEGGVLLCSNHIDNLDPPVVGINAPRPVYFMAKEELFNVPVLGKIVPHLNAFPVKRGMSDREALRKGLGILKEGNVLGLFPEGTRSKTGQLGKGLAGAGFFALRSEAHVVPCAIIGPYKAFSKLKVVYGKPIDMKELRERKASAEETTDKIMSEIRKLIEDYS